MAETLTAFGLVEHLWGRVFVPPRGDARYPRMSSPFRRPFPTADGWISVVVYSDENWRQFFELIGRRTAGGTGLERRLMRFSLERNSSATS